MKLLSISADKTVIVWQKDLTLNTWIESHRLGDVGGNVAGFLGGGFDPSGQIVMVHDLVGAFHVWRYNVSRKLGFYFLNETFHYNYVDDVYIRNTMIVGHRMCFLAVTTMQ